MYMQYVQVSTGWFFRLLFLLLICHKYRNVDHVLDCLQLKYMWVICNFCCLFVYDCYTLHVCGFFPQLCAVFCNMLALASKYLSNLL